MKDPEKVVIAGDWHSETHWATKVIAQAAQVLRDEDRKIVLHCGDFGVWPGRHRYLTGVNSALVEHDMELWFVDGNHEDFGQLKGFYENSDRVEGRVRLRSNLYWLPRGTRWQWHDRSWLAMGGAASPDAIIRVRDRDWWAEEAITDNQVARAVADGPADVIVAHDCPSSVRLNLGTPPKWWSIIDLSRSDENRRRLQELVDGVRPDLLVHGHYHLSHHSIVDGQDGQTMEVVGLNCNDQDGNWRVLNVKGLTWD